MCNEYQPACTSFIVSLNQLQHTELVLHVLQTINTIYGLITKKNLFLRAIRKKFDLLVIMASAT